MTSTSMDHPAIHKLVHGRAAIDLSQSAWRDERGEWRVPLGVTLPVTMAVSAGIWAGLFVAVKTLLF